MPLNDTMIRHLKPKPAAYKMADEKGLFLLVTPTGGKLWRLKFRNSMGSRRNSPLAPIPISS